MQKPPYRPWKPHQRAERRPVEDPAARVSRQLVADCSAASKAVRRLSVEEHLKLLGRLTWTKVAPGKSRATVIGYLREALPVLASKLPEMPPREMARLLQPLVVPYIAEGARVQVSAVLAAVLPLAKAKAGEFDVVDAATLLRALARLPRDAAADAASVALLEVLAPKLVADMAKATAAQCAGILQPLHLLRHNESHIILRRQLAIAAIDRAIATASDHDPATAAEVARALSGPLGRDAEIAPKIRPLAAAVVPHVTEQSEDLGAAELADILTLLGEKGAGQGISTSVLSSFVRTGIGRIKPEDLRGARLAAIVGSARYLKLDDVALAAIAGILKGGLTTSYRSMEAFEAARILGALPRLRLDPDEKAWCVKLLATVLPKLVTAAPRLSAELLTSVLEGTAELPAEEVAEPSRTFLTAALGAAEPRAHSVPEDHRASWRAAIKRHALGRQKIAKGVLSQWQES